MSKKNETPDTQQSQEGVADGTAVKHPAYVEDLLKNGTTTLGAKNRDDLVEMLNNLPADIKYGVGAVGFNPLSGTYSLRVDLINN